MDFAPDTNKNPALKAVYVGPSGKNPFLNAREALLRALAENLRAAPIQPAGGVSFHVPFIFVESDHLHVTIVRTLKPAARLFTMWESRMGLYRDEQTEFARLRGPTSAEAIKRIRS